MRGKAISRAQIDEVIDLVAKGVSLTKAAKLAGTHKNTINLRARQDEKLAARLEEARDAQVDVIRDQVWKLAIEGTRDFRLDRDGNEHEFVVYSEKMLELMARSVVPEYQDTRRLEITGTSKVEVHVDHDFPAISDVLEGLGILPRGAQAVFDAAPLALQPARADTEADGGPGSAPVPPPG